LESKRKIRVLVVDDSRLFRELIKKEIQQDPQIEVIDTASDPFDARDKIIAHRPDVMTLDVEMPKMNGIEFLRRLMPQYPIPVVVVSSASGNVFDAINAGAVDFVAKPNYRDPEGSGQFFKELAFKIKIASTARLSHLKTQAAPEPVRQQIDGCDDYVIAIGSSTGGPEAVSSIFGSLGGGLPGILVVQHMPPVFTRMFAERLDANSPFVVKEAADGDKIAPGIALIAPGGLHMKVQKRGRDYVVRCFEGDKVNGHIPSVDVLFGSVAEVYRNKAVGIILTGMGYDGSKGLLAMKKAGACTIGQDEQSCVVYGMPKVAFNIGAVDKQMSLSEIPKGIHDMLKCR